jgi:hypothetical protein
MEMQKKAKEHASVVEILKKLKLKAEKMKKQLKLKSKTLD